MAKPCDAGMVSRRNPSHVHTCAGDHAPGDDHWCGECKTRFWTTKKAPKQAKVKKPALQKTEKD